jgi:hypothetical protein
MLVQIAEETPAGRAALARPLGQAPLTPSLLEREQHDAFGGLQRRRDTAGSAGLGDGHIAMQKVVVGSIPSVVSNEISLWRSSAAGFNA